VIRTVSPREIRLCICRRRPNDSGALEFGILGGDETESPCDGVNENRVALLDLVRFVHERDNGRCLCETSSSGSGVDAGFWRDGKDLVPGNGDVLRVCAWQVLGRQG